MFGSLVSWSGVCRVVMVVGLLGDVPAKVGESGKVTDLVQWQAVQQRRSLLASGGVLPACFFDLSS